MFLLIQQSPNAISKDDIIRQVWVGDKFVSDDSLTRCISQLRKSLRGLKIESVYGYGYRIVLPVSRVPGPQAGVELIPAAAMEQFQYGTSLGQQHLKKSLQQAITIFRSLISSYPDFVQARISLAKAIITAIAIGVETDADVAIKEALDNISAATQQFPEMTELLSAKAWLYDITWDFDKAEKLHGETLKKNPDSAEALLFYSLHLIATGRAGVAIPNLQKVLLQRPYSIHARTVLARTLGMEGRFDEALAEIATAEEHEYFDPNPIIEGVKVMVSAAYCPAPELIGRAVELERRSDLPQYARVSLPFVLARCGEMGEAMAIVSHRLHRDVCSMNDNICFAKDLTAVGEYDLAAERLKAAFDIRYGYLPFALHSPELKEIFHHPLVREIRRQLFARVKDEP